MQMTPFIPLDVFHYFDVAPFERARFYSKLKGICKLIARIAEEKLIQAINRQELKIEDCIPLKMPNYFPVFIEAYAESIKQNKEAAISFIISKKDRIFSLDLRYFSKLNDHDLHRILSTQKKIKSFYVKDPVIAPYFFSKCAFGNLRRFYALDVQNFQNKDLESIIRNNQGLISLGFCGLKITKAAASLLNELSSLQKLKIYQGKFLNDELAKTFQFPKLKSLHLTESKITEAGLEKIASGVVSLKLIGCDNLSFISPMPHLVKLTLACLTDYSFLLQMTRLSVLYLPWHKDLPLPIKNQIDAIQKKNHFQIIGE